MLTALPLVATLLTQFGLVSPVVPAAQPSAAAGSYAPASLRATAAETAGVRMPLLGALSPTIGDGTLKRDGFKEVVINATWSSIEPSARHFSAAATASLEQRITAAADAGLSPSVDIGVQYAPSWIFKVGGGTRFEDQYGDVFSGSAGSGNDVPNAVTDMRVRTQLGDYLAYLGRHLTRVGSVRLGGGADNELRYPTGGSGSQADAFWFYDRSSQASLPASARGWVPGGGSAAQATRFLDRYNSAMDSYGLWLAKRGEADFPAPTMLEILLPGWGERPGEVASATGDRLRNTPDEVNQGLDWTALLPTLPANGRIVAYSTFADATEGSRSNPDPAAYIHTLVKSGMLEGGESTGNGSTTVAGENLMFVDAKSEGWYAANWAFMRQSETRWQVVASFRRR